MAASFSRSCLPQSPRPCTNWLKIAENSGALESRINNLACALLGKTGAGFKLNCFIPRHVTRPRSRLHYGAVTSWKLQGVKGHDGCRLSVQKITESCDSRGLPSVSSSPPKCRRARSLCWPALCLTQTQ